MLHSLTNNSLTNKVTIYIHHDYVAAVMHRGLLKKRIYKKETIQIRHADSKALSNEVIDSLKQLLNKPDWKGFNIHVILSGHFAKMRISKWNEALSVDERKSLVLDQMEEIYDETLEVFLSDDEFGKNTIAVAFEKSFYNALLELEQKLKIRLLSINPYFVVIANYWRTSIASTAGIVIKDNAFVYIAKIYRNSWDILITLPIRDGWEKNLERIIIVDLAQSEVDTKEAKIYFHEDTKFKFNLSFLKTSAKCVSLDGTTSKIEGDEKFIFARYVS